MAICPNYPGPNSPATYYKITRDKAGRGGGRGKLGSFPPPPLHSWPSSSPPRALLSPPFLHISNFLRQMDLYLLWARLHDFCLPIFLHIPACLDQQGLCFKHTHLIHKNFAFAGKWICKCSGITPSWPCTSKQTLGRWLLLIDLQISANVPFNRIMYLPIEHTC